MIELIIELTFKSTDTVSSLLKGCYTNRQQNATKYSFLSTYRPTETWVDALERTRTCDINTLSRWSYIYLNRSEFDSPEEVQIESDEDDEQGGDDDESFATSTDGARSERVADNDVTFNGHSDDEPDRVVTDSVQGRRSELTRPL